MHYFCLYIQRFSSRMQKGLDPDQTIPYGAVRSETKLFSNFGFHSMTADSTASVFTQALMVKRSNKERTWLSARILLLNIKTKSSIALGTYAETNHSSFGVKHKQEGPWALGRSPENDCLQRYKKALLLSKSSYEF